MAVNGSCRTGSWFVSQSLWNKLLPQFCNRLQWNLKVHFRKSRCCWYFSFGQSPSSFMYMDTGNVLGLWSSSVTNLVQFYIVYFRQVPKGVAKGWVTTETKKQAWLRRRIIFCLETVQEKVSSFPVSRIYASYTDKQYMIELFTRKHVILLI